jgi:hypothetical protein
MKLYCVLLVTFSLFTAAISRTDASTLYGATSSGGPGELWIIDKTTGTAIQDVGPLNDSVGTNYAVTGLAFNPITGVLFGSTGNSSGQKLLTINPATALVTVVGSFNAGARNTMADLAFDQDGNLFGIGANPVPTLHSINLSTGQATAIGSSGLPGFTAGGGLDISSGGIFYAVPQGNDFGTYNRTTGAYTFIGTSATPAGSPSSYGALAFDGNTLYGVNEGEGITPHLVTFDVSSGHITDIGPTVTNIDGIAFQPTPVQPALTIQRVTNSVVLSWPASAIGYRLQQNTNLVTATWDSNQDPITITNGTKQVTVTNVTGNKFYRLINP